MTKSLKLFIRESAIRDEVQTWTLKECNDYIEKHNADKNQSSLLKRKIEIVKDFYDNITATKKTNNGAKRKAKLSGIKVENLVKHAPPEAQDPNNNKLQKYQKNTGVYLWKQGYNPVKFLGNGASGVVWECDGKAVKVSCNRTYGPFSMKTAAREVKDIDELKILLGEDVVYAEKKYLAVVTHIDKHTGKKSTGKKAVFESDIAVGSLDSYAKKDEHTKKVKEEGIAHIIRLAKHALKGLYQIHNKGYSHNDIKPDNMLIIEKDVRTLEKARKKDEKAQEKLKEIIQKLMSEKNITKEKAQEEAERQLKGKKKVVLQIADFGSMTKINKTYHIPGEARFRAPDAFKLTSAAVAKRDSYSLGVSLLAILIKSEKSLNYRNIAKELISKGSQRLYYRYNLDEVYNKDTEENVVKFLDLITKMVQANHSNRISIEDALIEIKKLKGK